MGLLAKIRNGVKGLAGFMRFLAQLALISMVATICYDVFMRYVLKSPTLWSLEINTFLVLFITLFPAADVQASGSQLRITFFSDKLSPKVQKVLQRLTCLLGCLFGSIMVWKGFNMAYMAFRYDERMSTPLGTPLGLPYAFIPVGFTILTLYYLLTLIVGEPESKEPPRQQEV